MKIAFYLFLSFLPLLSLAQDVVEWSPTYQLTKADFQAKAPNTGNGQTYRIACSVNFGYQMGAYQFMFTKNFNQYVDATFDRKASWMDDGELTDRFLDLAKLEFDLAELYSRKFRQRMYEGKKTFSSFDFYQSIYRDIERQYTEHVSQIIRDTNNGQSEVRVREVHEKIVKDINELADYCKECKPKKKKVERL